MLKKVKFTMVRWIRMKLRKSNRQAKPAAVVNRCFLPHEIHAASGGKDNEWLWLGGWKYYTLLEILNAHDRNSIDFDAWLFMTRTFSTRVTTTSILDTLHRLLCHELIFISSITKSKPPPRIPPLPFAVSAELQGSSKGYD